MSDGDLEWFTRHSRPVQALPYTSWPLNVATVVAWTCKLGFDCYLEHAKTGTKVVVRFDPTAREEVVIRPGDWVVYDLAHERRSCRVQVWSGFEFGRQFRRKQAAA